MCDLFLKLSRDDEAEYLAKKHPNAFILLFFIAKRARRYDGHPDGLTIGQCHIGDHENMGLSRQEYRTALALLETKRFLQIVENCRTRQKSTTGSTTVGTLVKLCDSRIYDINADKSNHRPNHRPTTDQPPTNHEQERKRKNKKEEERRNTPTPFFSISEIKCFFREFVSLTKDQHASLLAQHGEEFLSRMLDALDSYKGSSGKEYKCDFATMKQGGWVIQRVKKESASQDKPRENNPRNTTEHKPATKYVGKVLRSNDE